MYPQHFDQVPAGNALCNCTRCLDERTPVVTLVTGAHLAELSGHWRFAVTSMGTVVVGEAGQVMHADIMGAGMIGEGSEVLCAGVLMEFRNWWVPVYVFSPNMLTYQQVITLLSRLTTWTEFIGDSRFAWPEEREMSEDPDAFIRRAENRLARASE